MLDQELLEQLRPHLSKLTHKITLAHRPSLHPKEAELEEMLGELCTLSENLERVQKGNESPTPSFEILKDQAPVGIHFQGIPGGHEFTTLILALLNSDGKGRMPEPFLQEKIKKINGPIHVRTYISLECTNCPDVVQALNQMALIHANMDHTLIDGELHPEEVQKLGIQGVPAVFAGEKLIHVGKAGLAELLETLENHYGIQSSPTQTNKPALTPPFDVVVLGGGPAGVAAAIYTARKGLKTALVAQKVGGQVNDTLAIANLISVPETRGPKLASDLRTHLQDYSIELLEHRRVEAVLPLSLNAAEDIRAQYTEHQPQSLESVNSVLANPHSHAIQIYGGETILTHALIIATGAKWRELGVPGEKDHIGHGVAFCPHCDGPFFKGKKVAVVGGGNSGVEAALDLAGICEEVTLLEYSEHLKADRVLVEKVNNIPNVSVIYQARTAEIVGDGKAVHGIKWENRSDKKILEKKLDGVFVQIGLVPNSNAVKDLVETNKVGEIIIDDHNRTSRPGIYAAGDVTHTPYKQIIIAMGEGAKAGLALFEDRMKGTTKGTK